MGKSPNLTVYDAYVEGEESTLLARLDDFFSKTSPDDQILLMSDIYGGSVNNTMFTYLTRPNVRLVSGINLSFLIEVATLSELSDETLASLVDRSRGFLREVKLDASVSNGDGSEDFF